MVSISCYNLTDDLTVESKSYPSEQTQLIVSEDMQVRMGGDVSLECKVISDPHVKCRVRWEHNGSLIKTSDSPRYHLVDSPPNYSLRISEVQEGDVGVYRCVASSVFHEVEGQGEVELTLQGVLIGTSYAVNLDPPPVRRKEEPNIWPHLDGILWWNTCITSLCSLTADDGQLSCIGVKVVVTALAGLLMIWMCSKQGL